MLNEARTLLRARSRAPVASAVAELPGHNPGAAPDEDHVAVHAALRRLDRRQREAVVLRFWLDLSLAEIARVTRVPLSTAKTRLYRGMEALHALIEEGEEK